MAEKAILHTNKRPSFFNKEMAIGGLLIPLAVSFVSTQPWVGLGALAAGLIGGGAMGKLRQEHELKHGKEVSAKPSFWNKDTLLGSLLGYTLGAVASLIVGAAVGAVAATAFSLAPEIAVGVGLVTVIGGTIGSTLIGGYLGGKHGQKREREEFMVALQQETQQHRSRAHMMEYANEPTRNFTQHIEQERERAAAQHHAR